jgi:hypothetical protein
MPATIDNGSGGRVDLGDLTDELERCEFPVTTGELLARYGPRSIDLAGSQVRFSDVLIQVGPRTFDSLGALESAVSRGTEALRRTRNGDAA